MPRHRAFNFNFITELEMFLSCTQFTQRNKFGLEQVVKGTF